MWLVSARTTLAFAGAVLGAVLLRALTGLDPLVASGIGALVGWVVASIVLGAIADRLDRSLHRMGGPRRRR